MARKNNDSDKKLDLILKEIFRLEKKMDFGFSESRGDFRKLQNVVDAYATKADTYFQEMVMLSHKVNRPEKWILQLAEKAGVHLKA